MAVQAARFAHWPGFSGVGCAFAQSYGSITSKPTQETAYASRVSEAAIKERNALDTATIEGNQSTDGIDAGDFEDFACRRQAGLPDLGCEPITRNLIDFGTRPMESLGFISANNNVQCDPGCLGFCLFLAPLKPTG